MKNVYLFLIVLSVSVIILSQKPDSEKSIKDRINDRDFPSIFQAWNNAENITGDEITLTAKHDLLWKGFSYFGLEWNNAYPGLGTEFTPGSVSNGLKKRKALLKINPNMIILMEVKYRDAKFNYLPPDSPYWQKDADGKYIMGWKEGGNIKINYKNEEYQKIIAAKSSAAVDSGIFDGIMLDWWSETGKNPEGIEMLKTVREAIGFDKLLIVNSNHNKVPNSSKYINGLYMECYKANKDDQSWIDMEDTLIWAESNLLEPRINCLETWYEKSRNDLNRMRATTTLALTHGNGYLLFSDPNDLSTPDHLHNWYSFWDAPLGKPTEKGYKRKDGMWQREFTNGTAVYNPVSNTQRNIKFKEKRIRVSNGTAGNNFFIKSMDGDIFIYLKK